MWIFPVKFRLQKFLSSQYYKYFYIGWGSKNGTENILNQKIFKEIYDILLGTHTKYLSPLITFWLLSAGTDHKFYIKGKDLTYEPSEYGLGYEYFHCMKKHANKVAQYVLETGEVDTFGDLLKRSIRTALKLNSRGITRNDIISICSHNQTHSVVPFIASMFLGVRVAPLDPTLTVLDSTHLLKLVKPRIIFVSQNYVQVIENALKNANLDSEIVVFGSTDKFTQFSEFLEASNSEESFTPFKTHNNKETAIILFSSGTTGLPKGICLSHFSVMAQTVNLIEILDLGESCKLSNYTKYGDDKAIVFLYHTSLYWISAVGFLTRGIFTGGAICVCSKFVPEDFWKVIDKYKVTMFVITPSQVIDVMNAERASNIDVTSVRVIATGGSEVPQKVMENLIKTFPAAHIFDGYGQTEASGLVSAFSNTPEDIKMQYQKLKSCGKAIPGFTYKVVDPESEEILGPNKEGELRYISKLIMNGYHNMDSSSAFDSDGWVKTGDIVYYDEDFCFYIVDRIKEMFKYRDWHINPASLEEILLKHPSVQEAVVLGIPHKEDGEHPMAVVILTKNGSKTTALEIEKFVEEQVSEKQRLRAGVKIVTDLPKTDSGKILRRKIKQMVLKGEI